MTDIGELVVRVKADSTQLQQEMAKTAGVVRQHAGQMEAAVSGLKEQFKELIPAVTVASIVEFGHRAVEAADRLNDLALRTGFAGSTLSALNIPLKQSGSSVDEFAASINRMNNLIGEAAKGTNQEAVKAFDALGLSVRKLQQLSPEEQFFAIAEALGKIDNQSTMTNAGMAIFGRSFASIIPLIKEAEGNLKDFTDAAKKNGDALTEEELKKIDEWGDRWTSATEHAALGIIKVLDSMHQIGQELGKLQGLVGQSDANNGIGFEVPSGRIGLPSDADLAKQFRDSAKAKGIDPLGSSWSKSGGAGGSNADLLRGKDSALKEYIANLQQETAAVGLNEKALFVARAEIEATAKAKEDWNNHLRASKTLLPDEKSKIDALAGSFYDLKKAQEENARVAKMMQDALSDSLAEIAVNFRSLQDTATSAIQAIAKEIIKAKITNPLSKGIIDSIPSFNIGKLLGFAGGGDPPVGVPSVVGENGPELFVPKQAGTVVPNGALGGTTLSQTLIFHMQPGLAETVGVAIQQAAPQIAAMAYSSTMKAIQSGGDASRIVGRRS